MKEYTLIRPLKFKVYSFMKGYWDLWDEQLRFLACQGWIRLMTREVGGGGGGGGGGGVPATADPDIYLAGTGPAP